MKKLVFTVFFFIFTLNYSWAFLPQPYLLSPTSGVQLKAFEASVLVNTVSQATGYQFQYDSVASFSSNYFFSAHSQTSSNKSPSFRKGLKVYWRARAYKSGDTSAWSDVYNFTTGIKMASNGPVTNTTGAVRPLSAYPVTSINQATYLFKVDTTPLFNSPIYTFKIQQDPFFIDTSLFQFGRKLYWTCTAINTDGDTLDWSDVNNYTFYNQPTLNNISANIYPRNILTWPSNGLAMVDLQWDTATDFSSFRLQSKLISPNNLQDTQYNLLFDKRYYFRIRAKFGNNLSDWSVVRNGLVYGLGAVTSPSNAAGTVLLKPTISWAARTGSTSQLQLYEDSVYTILILDTFVTGTSITHPATLKLNKKYYTRLRHMHALDTTAWSSTWFKTYTGQIILGQPSNNVVNQNVRLRFYVRKDTWADKAVIEIDSGSVFSANPTRFFISCDSLKYDGAFYHYIDTSVGYGGTFVWRAYQIMGTDTAERSLPRVFKTKAVPTLYFPPNGMVGIGTSTGALITGINGSEWVQWQLDTTTQFNSPELAQGIDLHIPDDFTPQYVNLNFPTDRLFEKTYYWRARCINRMDTSNWTNPFNFSTTTQMQLLTPVNNATAVSIRPYLSWSIQGSVSDFGYQYQLLNDTLLGIPQTKTLIGTEQAGDSAFCGFSLKYFWRARAFHSRDTSRWSAYSAFTTVGRPVIGTPILASPANGQLNVPLSQLTLSWGSAANASSYDAQVAIDEQFTTIVASGNTTARSIYFSGQQVNTKYWWRVRGRLDTLIGSWSTPRWFQTVPPVGLNSLEVNSYTSIYPNPADQNLIVETQQPSTIVVYDLLGTKILEVTSENILHKCETKTWKQGIYLIKITINQRTIVKKIEVIHQ
jgi:hypothetical protein